ncbi:MAG: bifunctional riboflavin kinase/FAD synthetase [Acetivibrio sp.]
MRYIDYSDLKLEKSAVCLGKFDGLHIGHRQLIQYGISMKKEGYRSVVFSFLMNPRLLKNTGDFSLIYTEEEKKDILERAGVDVLISYPFDVEMFSMEPECFIEEILVDKLDAKVVIVGSDFRFGHNRRGNVELLVKLSEKYGYRVKIFEQVMYKDEIVSSTRIRDCIKKGDIEEANHMLSEPYCVIGEVLHGRKIGRTLGMPTTNIIPEEVKLLPPNGVYASKTWLDGKEYAGISNVGVKPTVGAEEKRLIETFIFDYSGDLYGKRLKVDLYVFERPEKKFNSLEELKIRMEKDTTFGKQYFSHPG